MSCDEHRERLVEALESPPPAGTDEDALAYLERCEDCRAELERIRALRTRLTAAAEAFAPPSLDDGVMARLVAAAASAPAPTVPGGWMARWRRGARGWRLGLGLAGLAALVGTAFLALLNEPRPAWSIEQSIQAMLPFRALHLRGSIGGNARCELWARRASAGGGSGRLLIRIERGPVIWTEGNATHYYDPGSRTVLTDDALTAGFDPWPGPRLFALARGAGVRMVGTRWRFPARRVVVVEWSLMTTRGPTSARAEFDLDSKLLCALTQWDNLDRSGTPGFDARDIEYLADLPDGSFAVSVPADASYRAKPIEVAEAVLGLLALPDAGIAADDLTTSEAARHIVREMWKTVIACDAQGFKRLCPVTRGWSDDFLEAIMGKAGDPDAVVEVVAVEPGVVRGRSRLGPLSVVTSRVRHGDGGTYEEKTIVQHRLAESPPTCVIFSNHGQPFRLD